ncbi:TetR family transcriptional regulator C-terminal domain-containing protein [Corynebacterium glaucum]|uniref:TetR family transcriptional regulator C-terminal domain-containing protein n=1 Tax=Corynebacterium glaucum TaxID=187491 RepID=UPI00338EA534
MSAGLEREEQRSLDAETIAGLAISVLHGLTLSAVISPEDLPRAAHIDVAARALAKGLLS